MDGYPVDDRELDELHPFERQEGFTAEEERQIDYEDLVRALSRPTALQTLVHDLGCALIGYDGPRSAWLITRYAEKYGWKQAIHVVYGVLPSQGVR